MELYYECDLEDKLRLIEKVCDVLNHKAIGKLDTVTDKDKLDKLSKINSMVCDISSLSCSFRNMVTSPFKHYDNVMDKLIENFINDADEILDGYFKFIYSIDN